MKMTISTLLLSASFCVCTCLPLEGKTLTVQVISFDGASLNLSSLPEALLEGSEDLQSGRLTQKERYVRPQSVQTVRGVICPLILQNHSMAVDFSTTSRLLDPALKKVDMWLPTSNRTRATLTVDVKSATARRAEVVMTLKEEGAETLQWSFPDLRQNTFVVFSFAKAARSKANSALPAPSNLSDVFFLIIDYR